VKTIYCLNGVGAAAAAPQIKLNNSIWFHQLNLSWFGCLRHSYIHSQIKLKDKSFNSLCSFIPQPARCAPSRPPLQWKDKLIHSFPFIHQSSFHQLILVGLVLLFSSFGGAPAAGSGHNPPKKRTTQTNNSTVLRGKWNRAVHQKPLVFSSLCSFIPLGANARQQPTFFILPIRKRRMKRKFGLLNGLAR